MKTLNYLFILIFVLIYAFQSNAQEKSPDYIITLDNDTLRGDISEINNNSINFKRDGEQINKKINANQIKSYYSFQTKVSVRNINIEGVEAPYFLKEVLIGYVSLYKLVKPTNLYQFYLELPDKSIVALPQNNTSWAILRTNLLECSSQIFENQMIQKNYAYSEPFFKRVIKTYNQCVKPNERIHETTNAQNVNYGIILGTGIGNWNYTFDTGTNPFYNFNGNVGNQIIFSLGAFYSFGLSKKLSAEINVMYSKYYGTRTVPIISFGTPLDSYLFSIDEQYFNIPILLRYTFLSKNGFKLFGKAGPSIGYDLVLKETQKRESVGIDLEINHLNTTFIGYGIGIGIEKKVNPKMSLNLDLRYLSHNVQDKVSNIGINNSFQITVGLGFHK